METLVNTLATVIQHKKAFLAGAGALIVALILFAVLGGSGEEKLIDRYFDAAERDDAEAVLGLFYEPLVELERATMKVSETGWLKDVDKFYNRYGDEIVKREIVSVEAMDQDTLDFYNAIYFGTKTNDDLDEDRVGFYRDFYSGETLKNAKIKDGCQITVEVTYSNERDDTMHFNCFEIKGNWYLYSIIK